MSLGSDAPAVRTSDVEVQAYFRGRNAIYEDEYPFIIEIANSSKRDLTVGSVIHLDIAFKGGQPLPIQNRDLEAVEDPVFGLRLLITMSPASGFSTSRTLFPLMLRKNTKTIVLKPGESLLARIDLPPGTLLPGKCEFHFELSNGTTTSVDDEVVMSVQSPTTRPASKK
ncbi:MAG TPA: hypothetical protein VH253_08195 [Phycisphaerae bacterium]|nr:hypothetical protein [Phycisphaerae bacterium]